ncbi:MAG: hypothetical protein ACKOPM_11240 [Novosphingobium sp.]
MIKRLAIALALLAAIAAPAAAGVGKPKQVSAAKSVKPGQGVVAISIRSEIFLPDKLDVFFAREGEPSNQEPTVMRFSRSQSMLAIGNDTTDYAVKSYALPAGRYRLVAHGVNCPGVPPPGMGCAIRLGYGPTISRPSRGYAGETPSFIVEAGKLTVAGDFLLANSNEMLWSALPDAKLDPVKDKFAALAIAAPPTIPKEFVLNRPVRPAGMFDNFGRKY